jgi:hypothetical protein
METARLEEPTYVHDSTYCECCLDFWGLTPSTTATLSSTGAAGANINSAITGSTVHHHYYTKANAEDPENGSRTSVNTTLTTSIDASSSTGDHVDQKKRRRRAARAPVEIIDGNNNATTRSAKVSLPQSVLQTCVHR